MIKATRDRLKWIRKYTERILTADGLRMAYAGVEPSTFHFPKTMPLLTEKDFCREDFEDEEGRRCLMGHVRALLLRSPIMVDVRYRGPLGYCSMTQSLDRDIEVLLGHIAYRDQHVLFGSRDPIRFNDDTQNRKRDILQVWRIFLACLGYTEGNPATRTVASWFPERKKK